MQIAIDRHDTDWLQSCLLNSHYTELPAYDTPVPGCLAGVLQHQVSGSREDLRLRSAGTLEL